MMFSPFAGWNMRRRGTIAFCCAVSLTLTVYSQSIVQGPVRREPQLQNLGDAKLKFIQPGAHFDPQHQAEIFWHDLEWSIDLVPQPSINDRYSVYIHSKSGTVSRVELPAGYEQIFKILRTPNDKAIVLEQDGSALGDFSIIDLKEGKLIDHVPVDFAEVSPDRRFIFFEEWSSPRQIDRENLFSVYDVMKLPRDNVCKFASSDIRHEKLSEARRGYHVYPLHPGCTEPADPNDDNQVLISAWSEDSSKIAFADLRDDIVTLVLIVMPTEAEGAPRTLVYPLTGVKDVCRGATDAVGNPDCGGLDIATFRWDGDIVRATFHHRFGTTLALDLEVPAAEFLPIGQ